MKKTLVAILALGGMAMAASDLTYYDTTVSKGTNAGGNYYGACFALTSPATAPGLTSTTPEFTTETVMLDSITFTPRSGYGVGTLKLAVYKRGTGDGTVGTFIALSDASSTLTFNFDGQEISTAHTDMYQCMFVNADATVEDVNTFDGYKAQAAQQQLTVGNTGSNLPTGWGTYKSSGIDSWEGQYLPHITVRTHTVNPVPEPATATLSLLALAGLAARRRRH